MTNQGRVSLSDMTAGFSSDDPKILSLDMNVFLKECHTKEEMKKVICETFEELGYKVYWIPSL